MDRVNLFVYGTLMSGFSRNDSLTRKGEKVQDDQLDGFDLFVVHGEHEVYPYIVTGKGRVKGEVWSIPESRLPLIDAIEDVHNGLYKRRKVKTVGGRECQTYIWGGKNFPATQIDHGDFRRCYQEPIDLNR